MIHIRSRLTLLLAAVCLGVILGSAVFTTISLDNFFRSRLSAELGTQAGMAEFVIRNFVRSDSAAYGDLQRYARSADLRLTLIDSAGTVIFESDLPHERLKDVENHLQRPEVQEALRNGTGTSTRHSATLDIEMLYLARRVAAAPEPGTQFGRAAVVRVGVAYTHVHGLMADIRSAVIAASALVLAVVLVIAFMVSRRLAAPVQEMAVIAGEIREGRLDKRIPIRSGDEIGKLAESLNSMVDKLDEEIGKLRKLERVRSEFLGNVSHELRTPVFAVQGMLETLLNGALDDPEVRRDFTERALANTLRLNTLLGDLIEISRIESGDMKMSFRRFPLGEFLQQIAGDAAAAAAPRGVAVELRAGDAAAAAAARGVQVELSPGSSRTEAYGDKERLKQVMVNLIDNAVKYTREGGRVTVSYAATPGGVRIAVSDNGVGIAAEHLPRIFERFYRVDKERSREAGGTGLGLAIVKHIVEAHGSRVEVQSRPGEGSTFSFTLKA